MPCSAHLHGPAPCGPVMPYFAQLPSSPFSHLSFSFPVCRFSMLPSFLISTHTPNTRTQHLLTAALSSVDFSSLASVDPLCLFPPFDVIHAEINPVTKTDWNLVTSGHCQVLAYLQWGLPEVVLVLYTVSSLRPNLTFTLTHMTLLCLYFARIT